MQLFHKTRREGLEPKAVVYGGLGTIEFLYGNNEKAKEYLEVASNVRDSSGMSERAKLMLTTMNSEIEERKGIFRPTNEEEAVSRILNEWSESGDAKQKLPSILSKIESSMQQLGESPMLYYLRGVAYGALNNREEQVKSYQRVVDLESELLQTGSSDSMSKLSRIISWPEKDILGTLAMYNLKHGNKEVAKKYVGALFKSSPKHPVNLTLMAKIEHEDKTLEELYQSIIERGDVKGSTENQTWLAKHDKSFRQDFENFQKVFAYA